MVKTAKRAGRYVNLWFEYELDECFQRNVLRIADKSLSTKPNPNANFSMTRIEYNRMKQGQTDDDDDRVTIHIKWNGYPAGCTYICTRKTSEEETSSSDEDDKDNMVFDLAELINNDGMISYAC